jgi:hypothetical protein
MSIFRDSFTTEVRNQLEIRGKAMKDRNKNGLQYFNSRNSWVKMTSGVDVEDTDLARENILFGGVLDSKLSIKKRIRIGR